MREMSTVGHENFERIHSRGEGDNREGDRLDPERTEKKGQDSFTFHGNLREVTRVFSFLREIRFFNNNKGGLGV